MFARKREVSSVPAGVRVYAVGDVHGRLDLLDGLLEKILHDGEQATHDRVIVYLGDYVDRGADSKGVIDRLLAQPPRGFSARHLRGNHDQSLLDFLEDPSHYLMWKDYGARETLLSYGVLPPRGESDTVLEKARDELKSALPEAHLQFLNGLELSVTIGDYFFVHAGVRPGLPLTKQSPQDLMWIREEFLTSSTDFGKVVVHGHSPSPLPVKRFNRIGVDTGAYATGRLSCVVLEGTQCRFLQTGG
jgi:serine/threonine protein phosphatase 1